ncbi:MAG: hypothetical protein MJY92_01890 [Bacteroidales bacterium]|nr:hypothetical protein [Bacteroidales bacterium]
MEEVKKSNDENKCLEKDIHLIVGENLKGLFLSKDNTKERNTEILIEALAALFNKRLIALEGHMYCFDKHKAFIDDVKRLCSFNEDKIESFVHECLKAIAPPVINTSDNNQE